MALSYIRAATINSLDENSVQAKQCKLFYATTRDQMLEDTPWNFASGIKQLSLLVTEVFDWAYTYQYPSDCLRINRIIPDYERINDENRTSGLYYCRNYDNTHPLPLPTVEYKVFNQRTTSGDDVRVICANYPDLRIDYRFRVEDTTKFTNTAIKALAHLLASEIAIPVVGVELGRGLRSDNLAMYQRYLAAATVNDLNEQEIDVAESEFITVRR